MIFYKFVKGVKDIKKTEDGKTNCLITSYYVAM